MKIDDLDVKGKGGQFRDEQSLAEAREVIWRRQTGLVRQDLKLVGEEPAPRRRTTVADLDKIFGK